MRIKNWEYKSGVLFRRRVVLLAPCSELINDYSYGPRDIAERRRDFSRILSAREFLSTEVDNWYFSLRKILVREKSASNDLQISWTR